MNSQHRHQSESFLAKSMLDEILINQDVKSILGEVADQLRHTVLIHALNAIKNINQFGNFTPSLQTIFNNLAIKHSKDDELIGALLPNYTHEELLQTPNLGLLLTKIEQTLESDHIKNTTTVQEILSVMKAFDDIGMYYFLDDTVKNNNLSEYELIKNMIFLTKEEADMRFVREEECFAITYGIGTEWEVDLTENNLQGKCCSGKAKYFIPPVETRFQLFMDKFDKAITNNNEQEKARLKNTLNYYGIPLEKNKRKLTSAYYSKSYQPWFEKLAKDYDGNSLPLIASPSSSTARLFITLLHLNIFDKLDGTFDLDKAQIIANCIMAYFVFCGHHSFLEVTEIWNRALDYLIIYQPTKFPAQLYSATYSDDLYINKPIVERALPYARIDNYKSFFHLCYADQVTKRAKTYNCHSHKSLFLRMFKPNNENLTPDNNNKNIEILGIKNKN